MIILHFMAIGLATLLGFLTSRLHQRNDLLNSNVLTLPPTATPQPAEVPTLPYQTTDWIDVVDVHPWVNDSSSSSWFLVNSCQLRPIYQVIFAPVCPVLNEVPKINIHEGTFLETPQELSLQEAEDVVYIPEPELPQPKSSSSSWIPRPEDLLIIGLLVVPMLIVKIMLSVSSNKSDGQIDDHGAKARALEEDLVAHKEIARQAGGQVLELGSSNSHLKQQVSHLKSSNEELRSELSGVLQLHRGLEQLCSQQSETGKQLQSELEYKESVIQRLQSQEDKEQPTITKSDGQTQTDTDLQHARQELEAKQSELDAVQSDVVALQEELARATEDREYIERRHAETTRSLEQVQKKFDDEKATHKATKGNHRSCAATLEKEAKSRRGLEQANARLTSELKECKESVQKKDKDLKELRSTSQTATTLKSEIAALQTKLEASEKTNSSLRADNQVQRGQLSDKDDALNKFSSEASALEHQNKTLEATKKDVEAKKKNVDNNLEILSQKCKQLEEHNTALGLEMALNENLASERNKLKTELRKTQETLKSQLIVQNVQADENKRVQAEVEELKRLKTKDNTKVKTLTAQLQDKEDELQASQAANQRMIKPSVLAIEKERIDELERLVNSHVAWNQQLQTTQALQEQLQRSYEDRIASLHAENELLRKRAVIPTGPNYRRAQRERSTARQASNYPEGSSPSSPEGPTTAEPFVFESGSALSDVGLRGIAIRNPEEPPANPESPTTATALSLDDEDTVDGVGAGGGRRSIRVNFPPQPSHVDSSQSSLEPSGQSLEIKTSPDVEEDGKPAKQDASISSQQVRHDKTSSTPPRPKEAEASASVSAAVPVASAAAPESHTGSAESIPAPVDQPAPPRAGAEKKGFGSKGLESSRFAPASPIDQPAPLRAGAEKKGFGSKGLESSRFATTAAPINQPASLRAGAEKKGFGSKGLESSRFAPAAPVDQPPVDQPTPPRAGSENKGLESSRFATTTPVEHPAPPRTGFGSKGLESSQFASTASETAEPPKPFAETKGSQAKGLAASRFARPEAEGEDSQVKKAEDVLQKASATPEGTPQASKRTSTVPKGLEGSIFAGGVANSADSPQGSKRTSTTPKGLESSIFARGETNPEDTRQGSKRASTVPKGLEGSIFAAGPANPADTPQGSKRTSTTSKGLESSIFAGEAPRRVDTPPAGSKRASTVSKGLESSIFAGEAATPEGTPQAGLKRASAVPKGLEGSIFAGEAARPVDAPQTGSKRASAVAKGLEGSIFAGEAAKAATQPETETKISATEGPQTGEKAVKPTTVSTAKDPAATNTATAAAAAAEEISSASTKGLAGSRWASEPTGSSKETKQVRRASKRAAATGGADNNKNNNNNNNNNPGSQGAGATPSKQASASGSRSRSRGRSSRIPRRQEPAGPSNTSTPKSGPSPSRSPSAQGLGDKP